MGHRIVYLGIESPLNNQTSVTVTPVLTEDRGGETVVSDVGLGGCSLTWVARSPSLEIQFDKDGRDRMKETLRNLVSV